MGSLFGSSSSTVSTGDPVKQQAFNTALPYWLNTLNAGQNLYNNVTANPAYSGPRVADLNGYQTGSANTLGNFSQATAGNAQNILNTGLNNLGASNNYGSNATALFNQYNGIDPTKSIISNAGQYANNPFLNGAIDAASRDVTRNLYENQLTGIDRGATGTGNMNSSRAGVESAIASRGAGDRIADIASQMRSQAYGQGLNMSQNQFNQNLVNSLNANNQLLNAGTFGLNAMNGGQNFASNAFNQGQSAGGVYQTQNQNVLNGQANQFNESLTNQINALNAMNGTLGTGSSFGGGPSTATNTATPSTASSLGSLASTGASLAYLFSDIRMKENIEYVGKTPAGFNVYDYDYKPEFKDVAGHGRFRGVMAQEIEDAIPDAVSVASNGYKMVNYSKVR